MYIRDNQTAAKHSFGRNFGRISGFENVLGYIPGVTTLGEPKTILDGKSRSHHARQGQGGAHLILMQLLPNYFVSK